MKKERFISLLKAGQKEFIDIQLEGSFINENLSGLEFEKCFIIADFTGSNLSKTIFKDCNLKTCIFRYANINNASFEGNCLESTDFGYAQYSNLYLEGNTVYSCEFTKEMLEKDKNKSQPGFHIAEIKSGWFDVILINNLKTTIITDSGYLGNDGPRVLLMVLTRLLATILTNSCIPEWICWDDEPGAYIWKLTRRNSKIEVIVYSAQRDSCDISCRSNEYLEKEKIDEILFHSEGDLWNFIEQVVASFEKIKNLIGIKVYEKEWNSFPEDELNKLRNCLDERKKKD